MPRQKLRDLIDPKPLPKHTTLSLTNSFLSPEETVESYWFTDTIRQSFERILETAAQGRGQGYWIQAEYGAGKTHFLATLASLLAHSGDQALWQRVQDDSVRNYGRRLGAHRFFPLVLSLKGSGAVDSVGGGRLLSVLEREGVLDALGRVGLQDHIQVTTTDELLGWHAGLASDLRNAIARYVRDKTRYSVDDYQTEVGREPFAILIRQYCEANHIQPQISRSVRDRLTSVFNQLTSPSIRRAGIEPYTGLLVVIDEWEFWERLHPAGSPAAAHDEEVLETLAFVLAKDHGLPILTLVGSQTGVPAKLRGGQEGDRFINMPLLQGAGQREYDIIVSHRVRSLKSDHLPEMRQEHDYYQAHFDFAKNLDFDTFANTYPFQPRVFEAVRRITARDLPTTRSGIYILHQALNYDDVLGRDTLLLLSDLLNSEVLQEVLSTAVYKATAEAYRAARATLESLTFEDTEPALARKLLDTLFIWRLAHLEAPQSLSFKDLAEATLTTADFLTSEDTIALALHHMRDLPQIKVEDGKARFEVTDSGREPFSRIFGRFKDKITDPHATYQAWKDSLYLPSTETGGEPSLFGQYDKDKAKPTKVVYKQIEYPGEVIVTDRWQARYAQKLPSEDLHFRVVILADPAGQDVSTLGLQDQRIAVVIPNTMTDKDHEAARDYLAAKAMAEDYGPRIGPDADAIRQELRGDKRPEVVRALLATHLRAFRQGIIVTRDSLGIKADQVFQPGGLMKLESLVESLLSNAYGELPIPGQLRTKFTAIDAPKLFEGLFYDEPKSRAAESALDNFAVGLGLARPENPRSFAPTGRSTLNLLHQMLDEASDLKVWRVYERLSGPPYGLPYALITLYLLSFVRHSQDPVVELRLKPGHGLLLRSGQAPPRDVLTRANVHRLQWKANLDRAFDLLTPSEDMWPGVVPFGRILLDDLKLGADAVESDEQQARLLKSVAALDTRVTQVRRQLDVLKRVFTTDGHSGHDEDSDALAHVAAVAQADSIQAMHDRLSEQYTAPLAFKDDVAVVHRLGQLADAAAEIQAAKVYLDAVEQDCLPRDLLGDYLALSGQLSLAALVRQPTLWPGIQASFARFRERYQTHYQIHHRDYYTAISQIQASLRSVPRRLQALALLNGVEALGPALGGDLGERYRAFERLASCSVPVNDVRVETRPVCDQCALRLSQRAPLDAAKRFVGDLDAALEEQRRRLSAGAVRKVLADTGGDKLSQLVRMVELANLDALIDILDPNIVHFIAEALEIQGVGTVSSNVLQRLAAKYPTLEDGQVPAVVADLRIWLEEAFVQARQANPDKRTIRISLK